MEFYKQSNLSFVFINVSTLDFVLLNLTKGETLWILLFVFTLFSLCVFFFPNMQQLCAFLAVPEQDIRSLPRYFVEQAVTSLDLSFPERAALLLTLGSENTDSLGPYLHRQEQRARDPWRVNLERALSLASSAEATTAEERESSFVDAARAGLVAPHDALAATYVLFGGESARKFFASIVLLPPVDRIKMHNFFIAHQCGTDFMSTFGEALTTLAFPLFPHLQALRSLNIKLLSEHVRATKATAGGGAPKPWFPSVFRTPEHTGGYLAPLISNEHGSFADLRGPELAVMQLQAKVQQLNARIDVLTAQRTPQGDQQRGRGGVRGRGRGRFAQGGDAPSDSATTSADF